jgi:hypothetical protein
MFHYTIVHNHALLLPKAPYFPTVPKEQWARGGAVVEALLYKTDGRVFNSRLYHWNT